LGVEVFGGEGAELIISWLVRHATTRVQLSVIGWEGWGKVEVAAEPARQNAIAKLIA